MAVQHLEDLEKALTERGWDVTDLEETPGLDRWGISGTWEVVRGEHGLCIDFEGKHADGLITYPMDQAYACHVRDQPKVEIWFRKRTPTSSWRADLDAFVSALDALARA